METDQQHITRVSERLIMLEGVVRQQGEQIADQGGTLDHVCNTMDTILLPTQAAHGTSIASHGKTLDEHSKASSEAHDYIMSQRGAWQLIQRAGIVIAAAASVLTLALKVFRG